MGKGKPLCFLKFGRKQDLESLCNGNIYTNNSEYFEKLEETIEKKKCIGDENELKLPIISNNFRIQSTDVPGLIIHGKNTKMKYFIKEDRKKAIFCLYGLYEDDFVFNEITNKAKLQLSEEKKKYIINNFDDGERDSVVIFQADLLITAIEHACRKENIEVIHDEMKFYDINMPYIEQIEDYINKREERFFWKDEGYLNQQEYRFIFAKNIEEGQVLLNIGEHFKMNIPVKIKDFISEY